MILKFIVGVVAGLTLVILLISWFLAPDNLMNCGATPSQIKGCGAADVIVAVSGGDTTARTQEAIDLYQAGWAPRLIFSGAASDKSGPSNAEVMRDQALKQGVPENAIIIEQNSQTTEQNAARTSNIFSYKDIHSAIIVTSAYHMKRTMLEFEKKAPGVNLRAHPVKSDDQWSAWWWLTPFGWYLAISELIKIVAVKIGVS